MNIHEQIKEKLAAGEIVYSFALGRVGEVVAVGNPNAVLPITIRPRKGHDGATTFTLGDPVELVERQDASGNKIWAVVNV